MGTYALIICKYRPKYVDRHTIHILGNVIPEGQERGPGAPVRRELVEESKKKGSKGTRGGAYWSREGERIGVTQETARDMAKQAQKRLLTLETDQKDLRKVYLQADSDRSDASKIIKALSKGVDDSVDQNQQDRAWHEAYDNLYQTRRVASQAWNDWARHQGELKSARSEVYAFSKVSTTKPRTEPPASSRRTIVT